MADQTVELKVLKMAEMMVEPKVAEMAVTKGILLVARMVGC